MPEFPYLMNIIVWCMTAYKSIQLLIHSNFSDMSQRKGQAMLKIAVMFQM